jgi:hypothetical protein
MPKLMRGLVLGAMLAVMGSATAAVAQTPPDSRNEAVQRFREGEQASQGQPLSGDQAVQRHRAGERASIDQPNAGATDQFSPAQPGYRDYYQANRPEPTGQGQAPLEAKVGENWRNPATTPVQSAEPSGQPDRTVVVLSILTVVAVLVLTLDAMSVRRKARKAAHPAI